MPITKAKMLYQIDHLIEYVQLDGRAWEYDKLIKSRLSWMDNEALEEYFYEHEYDFYEAHPKEFKDDWHWEFLVED